MHATPDCFWAVLAIDSWRMRKLCTDALLLVAAIGLIAALISAAKLVSTTCTPDDKRRPLTAGHMVVLYGCQPH